MTWNEILEIVADQIGESVSGTAGFFKEYPLKLFAATVQTRASRIIKCLDYDDWDLVSRPVTSIFRVTAFQVDTAGTATVGAKGHFENSTGLTVSLGYDGNVKRIAKKCKITITVGATNYEYEIVSITGNGGADNGVTLEAGAIATGTYTLTEALAPLPGVYSIYLDAGRTFYDLPSDFISVNKIRYEDTQFLNQSEKYPDDVQRGEGVPAEYFIQGKRIGFDPIPATGVENCYLWYTRLAPPYAFRMKESNADSTTATYTFNGTSVIFTITGGANAGIYTFAIATYRTMEDLIYAVNDVKKGITLTKCELCDNQHFTRKLEVVSGLDIHGVNKVAFLDPELPEEMIEPIIVEKLLAYCRRKDRDDRRAELHEQKAEANINGFRTVWKERFLSTRTSSIKEAYYEVKTPVYKEVVELS